jgi:hypothetical protein
MTVTLAVSVDRIWETRGSFGDSTPELVLELTGATDDGANKPRTVFLTLRLIDGFPEHKIAGHIDPTTDSTGQVVHVATLTFGTGDKRARPFADLALGSRVKLSWEEKDGKISDPRVQSVAKGRGDSSSPNESSPLAYLS